MELLVELVVGVAWPVTVLTIVFVFKREAVGLLARLTKLRYKELEADFGETLRELKAETPVVPPSPTAEALPAGRLDRRMSELLELAEVAPRAAVLEAWLEVEKAVRDLAIAADVPETARSHDQLRQLVQREVVPASYLGSFDELRRLRNTAAHSPEFEISTQVVQGYVDFSLNLAAVFEVIRESRGSDQNEVPGEF